MGINRSMVKSMESSANSNAIVTYLPSASPAWASRLPDSEADSSKRVAWFMANLNRLRDEAAEQMNTAVADRSRENLEKPQSVL
jgi:hypothetical protein